jgi:hypothetical protein
LLYGSENPTIKARDAVRIKAAQLKCMRKAGGCTWRDYKKNTEIAMELNMTPVLDKIQDRLTRIIKKTVSPKGRRKQGKTLKRLQDV